MKTLIGCIVGAALFAGAGFTYDVTRAGITENIVDVRIVELGGHEYVVASSCTPQRSSDAGTASKETFYGNKAASVSIAHMSGGGSSISVVHHVGCKACTEGK